MGSSQRKYKQLRTKVCVGLPKKNPRLFKPSFFVPPNLLRTLTEEPQWDNQGTVNNNYSSFGVLFDPNSLTEPSPNPQTFNSGHYLEEDYIFSFIHRIEQFIIALEISPRKEAKEWEKRAASASDSLQGKWLLPIVKIYH
ncbi:hypothetical protein D0Y65_053244 [Glycine soja]|uniref:Uncharacterized protein n=2 Tax=Glycine soja TaxID=3848 RepID=A0A445F1C2_GLYSO|nr:hypothetical protein D0Y65_053244 [Glycine soja]